jgi:hypothetical protein
MPTTVFRLRLGVACLLASLASGCATLQFPWDRDRFPQATAGNPVVKIVCLWEPAEGRDPEGLPCRGFAGQLIFLSSRHALPVKVDGDVRIYLFDDIGTPEDQAKPLRQFDFTCEAWNQHLSRSAVGPTYSVFVPYVRRGQYNAKCTLRVRLTPKVGPPVFSDATTLPLRGPTAAQGASTPIDTGLPETPPAESANSAVPRTLPKTTIPLMTTSAGSLAVASPLTTATPHTAADTDVRLARMEKLLAEALAEKSRSAAGAIQQAHHEVVAPEASDDEPPRRIKLQRAEPRE